MVALPRHKRLRPPIQTHKRLDSGHSEYVVTMDRSEAAGYKLTLLVSTSLFRCSPVSDMPYFVSELLMVARLMVPNMKQLISHPYFSQRRQRR